MKRILLATAGVAVVAVFAATIGFAQPTATTGSVAAEAAAPLPKLPANIKERQRFIVGVKCDAPPFGYINVQGKNAGFDVEIAKWFARLCVRPRDPRLVHLRADAGPRAAADDRPRRPRHLDLHLHRRPRHADRLLARLLQGDGTAAGEERRAGAEHRRHPEPEGGDDERLDLRPLAEALLHERPR